MAGENVLFSGFSGFKMSPGTMTAIVWIGLALFIGVILFVAVIMMMMKAKEQPIIELGLIDHRAKKMAARLKKTEWGMKALWIGKIKKFLPNTQQKDEYLLGKKNLKLLVKDNNGLHHTARLPTITEYKRWCKVVYNIDLDEIKKQRENPDYEDQTDYNNPRAIKKKRLEDETLQVLNTIYLLPNPSENLKWLSDQVTQAKTEFASAWWKSPVVAILGTVVICAFVFIITLIITKKM